MRRIGKTTRKSKTWVFGGCSYWTPAKKKKNLTPTTTTKHKSPDS